MFEKQPHSTPKDFALWAGAMIALYWCAGALITLLFSYIDILFPDTLRTYYYDPFSGPIRFAMASLIILVPIYIWLTRILNQDIRKHPEKKDIGIRRWLLYITLLISGVVLAGDLIALVNNFLGGELTTRFFLKVVTVFVVVGSAFAYYWADLKGYWEKNEAKAKGLGALIALIITGAVIAGFFIMGSPSVQRDLRLDQDRINDLQSIQWQVIDHWQNKGILPETLVDTTDSLSHFTVPTDPETQAPYEYRALSDLTFELCATFGQPTPEYARAESIAHSPLVEDSNWEHTEGRNCFERTIDPDRYPARNKPVPTATPLPVEASL